MLKKSVFELSVRTHPGLVEAAVLTAHAEGLDGWRRLLRHQQSLLQLDLLLQLHQHRRLHAVPEGRSRGYTCSFASEMSLPPLCSLTWRRCGRSPAGRGKLAEAPCAALRKTKTTISRLLTNDPKKQLPLRLSREREEKRRDEVRQKHSKKRFQNVTLWAHTIQSVFPWGVAGWFTQKRTEVWAGEHNFKVI